jgi:protein-export SecD/SecF family membrane protein
VALAPLCALGGTPAFTQVAWRVVLAGGALPAAATIALALGVQQQQQQQQQGEEEEEAPLAQAPEAQAAAPWTPALSRTLLGTAGCWFLYDVSAYGIGVYTPQVLQAIYPAESVQAVLLQAVGSHAAALAGAVSAVLALRTHGSCWLQRWGFAAVAVFMCVYYLLFGVISSVALAVNLLLLVAVLSMLQATLTLPGMAAMALVLGMAIDANVLINERVREELRGGASPQAAIHAGYDRAWATIIDSNVTTLIAGLALLAFGSGPVRGFAVVHCLGILTSMFSGVFFSRGVVNLWYGRQKKLKSVSIGTVWRPDGAVAGSALVESNAVEK